MTDPYVSLGRELSAAAERRSAPEPHRSRLREWLSHPLRALTGTGLVVLAGGAIALAATGVLEGSTVKPEVPLNPSAGNGLPVPGAGNQPLLRATDPAGGLEWGMRVLHTTRGQVCVQVARMQGERLGLLGLDGVYGNDGRFHPLPAYVLPPGYGGAASQGGCVHEGRTLIEEDANADRSAVRLLPGEFPLPGHRAVVPPTSDLRTLAFGVLGPHATSVTVRTPSGETTVPVTGPDGAFLVVEPGGYVKNASNVGSGETGLATPHAVEVTGPGRSRVVTAATFRFGARMCSQGTGPGLSSPCPLPPPVKLPPRPAALPDLHEPIRLILLRQSPAACREAFLLDPCYKGLVEFTAPYGVTSATSDYEIHSFAHCHEGGRPETGWALERDVRAHSLIRSTSLGLFRDSAKCASHEGFEVRYIKETEAAPGGSVVLGKVLLSQARP